MAEVAWTENYRNKPSARDIKLHVPQSHISMGKARTNAGREDKSQDQARWITSLLYLSPLLQCRVVYLRSSAVYKFFAPSKLVLSPLQAAMGQEDGSLPRTDRVEVVMNEDKGAMSQSVHLENRRSEVVPPVTQNLEIDSELRRRTLRKLDFNAPPSLLHFVCTNASGWFSEPSS